MGNMSYYGGNAFVEVLLSDFNVSINLSTGTGKFLARPPFAMEVTGVRANVATAPTGATVIIDINNGGTTILSTKLSIDISEKTSKTATSKAVVSNPSILEDDEITVDIDQVGSTVTGAGLSVWLIGHRK